MVVAVSAVVAFVAGAVVGWVVKARVLAIAARAEVKFDVLRDAFKA